MTRLLLIALSTSLLAAAAVGCDPPVAEGEGEGEGDGEGEGEAEGEIENPYGFSMRIPQTRRLPCPDCQTPGDKDAPELDFVCSFDLDGHDAVVYLRATPTSISSSFFAIPVFDTVEAFISENGTVSTLADASYDYGGGHHNDFFGFTIAGVRYTYDHSSYGFGFRACQPADCLKREEGDEFVDGCLPQRTVPVTCVAVDNPLPALVDTFARCEGDPESDQP